MLSIAAIRKNEAVLRLIQEVTDDFLQNSHPTPQPYIYKKLKGRDEIIGALLAHDFLYQFFGNEFVPGLLAFEFSEKRDVKRSAKGCSSVTLWALANLFEESQYKKQKFEFAEI